MTGLSFIIAGTVALAGGPPSQQPEQGHTPLLVTVRHAGHFIADEHTSNRFRFHLHRHRAYDLIVTLDGHRCGAIHIDHARAHARLTCEIP